MNYQKKLKLLISTLKQKQLVSFFDYYQHNHIPHLKKSIKKISFNCYESTLEINSNVVNGYGKNYNEALVSGILNLIDFILQNESNAIGLKESLKRFGCGDKVKTMPAETEKKVVNISRAVDAGKTKDSMMKSVKTIKDQIFESLNHGNIQIKGTQPVAHGMQKISSYAQIHRQPEKATPNNEITKVMAKIKELEDKLLLAEDQNQYLKAKLKEKEHSQRASLILSSSKKLQKSFHEIKTFEPTCLKDISNLSNNYLNSEEKPKQKDVKLRSYSLSSSVNPSAFSSKNCQKKVKIPKLNLEMLPNYHGKSNKSLNQSLLQNYEKKYVKFG